MKNIIIRKEVLNDVRTGKSTECFVMQYDVREGDRPQVKAYEDEQKFLDELSTMMKFITPVQLKGIS